MSCTARSLPLLLVTLAVLVAAPLQAQPRLNEIRVHNVAPVDEEYIELAGFPGEPLNGLSIVILGDGGPDNSGTVEFVLDLSGYNIPADGHFLIADIFDFGNGSLNLSGSVDLAVEINLENNDNITVLLVDGLDPAINSGDGTGNGGSDVDQNADGNIDNPCNCTAPPGQPWLFTVDEVALIDNGGGGDLFYSPIGVGPDMGTSPAHVFRCDDNPFDWRVGVPDNASLDTPGEPNNPICAGLLDRPTAIAIFEGSLNPSDPDSSTTAAYMYLYSSLGDSTLMPGDVVSDADSTFSLTIVNPTYMFWVDYEVRDFFGHRTEFVFVDATNGFPVNQESTTWPVINGVEFDDFVDENEDSPDLLYGNGFVGDIVLNPAPPSSTTRPIPPGRW